ncbi:hypothetical protein H4R99_005099 [Coemansia sp. RSA 1722]|nr:hypothetical protein H4R99_005099 [Coemansia sp. RSA 1722]
MSSAQTPPHPIELRMLSPHTPNPRPASIGTASVGIDLPDTPSAPLLPVSPAMPSFDEKLDPLQQKQQYAVGWILVRRLGRIASVMHAYSRRRIGLWCLLLLAAKIFAEIIYYFAGRLPSEFYQVLGDRDRAAFFPLLLRCFVVVVVAGAFKAALDLGAGMLGVEMRRALTTYTHHRYITETALHTVATQGVVDNPDQRIAQDIEHLASSLATVLPELLIAPFLVIYYTVKCWAISGVIGPFFIYLYFAVGALASRCAMPPVIRQVYRLERAEGDFRFLSLRMVEFAESIAFFSGEAHESSAANASLGAVVDVQRLLLWKQFWLALITQVFSYLGSTVSYAVIAVPIFMGRYEDKSGSDLSSIISLNAFVSLYLIYRFSVIIEQTKKLSDVAGFTTRIVQLWEEVDRADLMRYKPVRHEDSSIEAVGLAVQTPAGARLISSLDLRITRGDSLIITGPNGVGKTSLLRSLAGLWRPALGSVSIPHDRPESPAVFFLPQTPYIVAGSLRDQLSYPGRNPSTAANPHGSPRLCTDSEILRILDQVGLTHIVHALDTSSVMEYQHLSVHDRPFPVQFWLKALSPGEQQKISVGRVLFWSPMFAILDECTSSLDARSECAIYQALIAADITLVSVGHRDELQKYHKRRLHLTTDRYTLSEI